MVHGENLIAAKMNPDLTVCHMGLAWRIDHTLTKSTPLVKVKMT